MDALEAIRGRRSVRQYAAETPSREVVEQIIAEACQAPNSINRQAWRFVVVSDRHLLAEISNEAKDHAALTLAGQAPEDLTALLARVDFSIFYNAPVLVVICATQDDPMVAEDCALAAQTLMLAAHARGLGSCWIGFAEGWLRSADGKRRLGLPKDHVPIAPIILGYPQAQPEPPGRRPPDIAWIGEPGWEAPKPIGRA